MKWTHLVVLVAATCGVATACGGDSNKKSASGSMVPIAIPRIYPPVRASTPSQLIANPTYAAGVSQVTSALTLAPAAGEAVVAADAVNLATVVQERLYTMGPTEILRIVSDVDARTATLDTRPGEHPCLTGPPIKKTYALPGGQTFEVKLQCLQRLGGKGAGGAWLAFGFSDALAWDGGVPTSDGGDKSGDGGDSESGKDGGSISTIPEGGALGTEGGGRDFYLVEGQPGGMGSAYHFDRETGKVEAWIAVADSRAPNNSQVIMHMVTDRARATLELALAGSGVGMCAAHLQAAGDYLYIDAKTNAPPPPGTPMMPGLQYCDSARVGCFAASDLSTDLGGDDAACATIARPTFSIAAELDASPDPESNVTPATISTLLLGEPSEVPLF